jgi:uncharacterized protein YjbI with pentapeptide repeats
MSSASSQRGLYNISNNNNNQIGPNNSNSSKNITKESFIPGNFYKVVYRYYSSCNSNFSSGYVESVFYNVTEESGAHGLINGLTHKEINNANKLALRGNEYVLLINVNEENKRNRGKFELVVLDKVRSVKKLKNNEFIGLNLSGLQLQGADLRGADLGGAVLREANLEKADLRGADLRGANLEGTTLIKAKLQKAHLEGINLIEFDLYGAKLEGAHLQGVQLQKASLVNANLKKADLRGANLIEADLRGAKLEGAKLEGADLRGVRLTETNLTNLNRASLTQSQRNGIIIMPKNWNNSSNGSNSSHSGGRFLHLYTSGNSKTRSVKEKAFITFKKI